MKAFYNDNDPFAVKWLENLIADGLITQGVVDGRGIEEITEKDLEGFERVHLFAGIGGWDCALQLAGWEGLVWTMSCPCQPYSCAGRGRGAEDPRHLWPQGRRLVAESLPPIVFGEQVASKAGREWLAGVRADLEDLGYQVGAADLCAASTGSPQIRQRLWWVAVADPDGRQGTKWPGVQGDQGGKYQPIGGSGCGMVGADGRRCEVERKQEHRAEQRPRRTQPHRSSAGRRGPWEDTILLRCGDGKTRRIPAEPSLFPLAPGLPGRVGLLRGAGNSIAPEVAAEFVMACKEAIGRSAEP